MKFYSELLNKLFDSQEDCAKAEEAHKAQVAKAEAEKKAKSEKRAARAKEVEEFYKAAVEAKKAYNEKLNAFIKDYGSFHFTTSEPLPVSSLFDLLF